MREIEIKARLHAALERICVSLSLGKKQRDVLLHKLEQGR